MNETLQEQLEKVYKKPKAGRDVFGKRPATREDFGRRPATPREIEGALRPVKPSMAK